MNSVERVFAALRRQQPDRVPVMEFLVDERVARAAVPGCRDVADCMDRLDLDAVACGAAFLAVREHPDGSYVDEWGVTYQRGPEVVPHPIAGPIRTLDDARVYSAPDPNAPHRLGQLPDLVRRYKGHRAICFHHRAAFMWSAYLMGIENILAGFLDEPETVTVVMDKVLEANMGVVRRAIRAGAEVIVLGDDYAHNAGPMMSPAIFKEFIQPRLARMIAMIHQEGAFCIKHSDGNLYPILNAILETGPDALNPIEPVAGMTLRKTRALAGSRFCLAGNIDCAHLLPFGSVSDVQASVRSAIAEGAPGGGYILTSSNSIHSSCRPENFVAMVRTAQEIGSYA